MPGLGASFGRGAATNYQRDLSNSDCILIMGSNMAEAHPVGFRWPLKARERGAVLIHVDPHFSRTSALCDIHIPIRTGADIAFLGGIINYIIEHDRWFKEYVTRYTNAPVLLNPAYKGPDTCDGLFVGYDPETRLYDRTQGDWNYLIQKADEPVPSGLKAEPFSTPDEDLVLLTDPSLAHPMCIFQVLKRHYASYTPEKVSEICGCRPEDVIKVAELLCRNSGRERTSAIVYAVGWTQHSTGVQMIRAAGIVQLLLGNMGRPGGGIQAMRGHCSIQGSTDIPTLYDLLPGYLPQPAAIDSHRDLRGYLGEIPGGHRGGSAQTFWGHESAARGYWTNMPKFMVSLLKAWYGDAATERNDFGYSWIGKRDDVYSQLDVFEHMQQGRIKGLFLVGQNPAAGAPNARVNRAALRQLEWLVVRDWFEHESANYWYADPEVASPAQIKTEVFFLPAAVAAEKDGSMTNTDRLIQWHDKAVDPPGDCRSDAWFIHHLGRRLKELYADSTLERDLPIRNLTWNYDPEAPYYLPDKSRSRIGDEPDIAKILKEINGYSSASREQLHSYTELKDDGSTACGCWIYSGVFPPEGNKARARNGTVNGTIYPDWGFAWPSNRRIMYNRASADPDGNPWSERKRYICWDGEQWAGPDIPDFAKSKSPGHRPDLHSSGTEAIAGDQPFIMHPDGRGWLYVPEGVYDGPLPTHYEPRESPFSNQLYNTQFNPTLKLHGDNPLNPLAAPGDPAFPLIATTYRLTEHYLSGPMSRFNSWLNELQPEMFVELSPELAGERKVEHGGWVVVSTPRGEIEARAMVTRRIRPLRVAGRVVHQVGIPIHWSYAGETVGGSANVLTALLTDINVSMHEAKAFVCQVRAGRTARNHRPIAVRGAGGAVNGPVPATPAEAQPEGLSLNHRRK